VRIRQVVKDQAGIEHRKTGRVTPVL
jgi:hypothetical protein